MTQDTASAKRLHLPKAAELVAAEIRREIVRGNLRPGDNLPPEAKLMERFGISRPTVRESLRVLESEQLITVHRGSRGGALVRSPDPSATARSAGLLLQLRGESLQDVLRTMVILECGAIHLLATEPGKADVARLRDMLAEESDALDDVDRFGSCALKFHQGLVAATGNDTLVLLGSMLQDIIERHTAMVAERQPKAPAQRAPWRKKSHDVHLRIVELIEAGSAEEATDLWRRHAAANHRAMAAQLPIENVLDLFD